MGNSIQGKEKIYANDRDRVATVDARTSLNLYTDKLIASHKSTYYSHRNASRMTLLFHKRKNDKKLLRIKPMLNFDNLSAFLKKP